MVPNCVPLGGWHPTVYPWVGYPWVGGTQLCIPGLGTLGWVVPNCVPLGWVPLGWVVPNCVPLGWVPLGWCPTVCVSADMEFPSARVSSLRFMGTACYSSFVLYTCSVGTLYPLNAQPGLVHIYFAVLNLGILQLLQQAGRRG